MVFMFYVIIEVTSKELILLSKEQDDDYQFFCTPLDKTRNETITWFDANDLPLDGYEELNESNSSEDFSIDLSNSKWQKRDSFYYDFDARIFDERWKKFETKKLKDNNSIVVMNVPLNETLKLNHFSLSLFTSGPAKVKFSKSIHNSVSVDLTMDNNITKIDYYKWTHLQFAFLNKTIHVTDFHNGNNLKSEIDFSSPITNIQIQSANRSFWKIHKYDYFYSNESMAISRLANFSIKKPQGSIIMHMSMCNGCEFEVILSNGDNVEIHKHNIKEAPVADRAWIQIVLSFRNVSDTELNVDISTHANVNVTSPFWAIDSYTKIVYEPGETSKISIKKANLNGSYVYCGYVDEQTSIGNNENQINFNCPYNTFGPNCSTIRAINVDSWQKICEKNSENCTCLWGFHGSNCDQLCDSGFWGINCTQNCDQCINNKCDTKRGVCEEGCKSNSTFGNLCQHKIITNNNNNFQIYVESVEENQIIFKSSNNSIELFNARYQCQYRKIDSNNSWSSLPDKEFSEEISICNFDMLEINSRYEVQLLLIMGIIDSIRTSQQEENDDEDRMCILITIILNLSIYLFLFSLTVVLLWYMFLGCEKLFNLFHWRTNINEKNQRTESAMEKDNT